jgi:hypothetical protein
VHGHLGFDEQHTFLVLVRSFQNMLRPYPEAVSMPIHEGTFSFLKAGEFDQTYRGLEWGLLTSEFKAPAATFAASFDRIAFLHGLPVQLIAWADNLATCVTKTRLAFGIDAHDESKDQDAEFRHQVSEAFSIQRRTEVAATEFGGMHLDGMMEWETSHNIHEGQATTGVQALFAAMIMGAYAALETLAADLWILSLNKIPQLAQNWVGKNAQRQIPMAALAGHNFNLSEKMGTVLYENRRVSFDSWNDIKTAYSEAFAGSLDTIFNGSNAVYLSEKTRHLFAHRGGLVDRKFRDEMKDIATYNGLIVGERLRLTGPVVRDHVDACLKCGSDLLKAADLWMIKHEKAG